jgi:hypothetical protein
VPVLMSGVSINQGMVCNHTDSSVLGKQHLTSNRQVPGI